MVSKRLKLLVVSLDAYSLLNKQTRFVFGGAEIRLVQLVQGLAQNHAVDVTLFTLDHGLGMEQFGGITTMPHPRRKSEGYWTKQRHLGRRILNRVFKTDAVQDTTEVFNTVQPDVALILGMSPEALELAQYCKHVGIPFVFGLASDNDLGGDVVSEDFLLKWTGLKHAQLTEVLASASLVLAQTPAQANVLEQRHQKKAMLLLNPISLALKAGTSLVMDEYDVVWIGKTSDVKRPELFLEVAKRLPMRRFLMVLNRTETIRFEHIQRDKSSNVHIIEQVPPELMEATLRFCKTLVNTSSAEGFANTFLQAAKLGIPVVSVASDPNTMLSVHGCGIYVANDSPEVIADQLDDLLRNDIRLASIGEAGIKYVAAHHDAPKIVEQLYLAMLDLTRKKA
jgi:glycosyltransferase involved in cell wall biosynthesis